jgi:hypothetical protein
MGSIRRFKPLKGAKEISALIIFRPFQGLSNCFHFAHPTADAVSSILLPLSRAYIELTLSKRLLLSGLELELQPVRQGFEQVVAEKIGLKGRVFAFRAGLRGQEQVVEIREDANGDIPVSAFACSRF